MRKFLTILAGTILLAACLLLCLKAERSSAELSFRVYSGSGSWEKVDCWKPDLGIYYVFLPSYASLDRVEVRLPFLLSASLNGTELSGGMTCGAYEFDTAYPFFFKGIEGTLEFRQSSGTGAMFLHTAPGTMEKVDSDKSFKGYGKMNLFSSNGTADYSEPRYLMIKGRGNSTWDNLKKPYKLELSGEAGLLGMDPSAGWVLLANAEDVSGLRNKLILDFASENAPYDGFAPSCKYVDLYLDGEYHGMFLLCERVENQPCADGRILCRLGQYLKVDHFENAYRFDDGLYLEIITPKNPSEELKKQVFSLAERYADWIVTPEEPCRIPDYIDMESFARKYLIEELFANTDALRDSQYFLIDLEQEKVFAGPCWDYDYTLGLLTGVMRWWSPTTLWVQSTEKSWCGALFRDERFRDRVRTLYFQELEPQLRELLAVTAPNMENTYYEALMMNDIRWSRIDVNLPVFVSDYLDWNAFLEKRLDFFSDYWNSDPDDFVRVNLNTPVRDASDLNVRRFTFGGDVIPSPQEMLLDETYQWYEEGSDAVFDRYTVLERDLTLYARTSGGSG